MKLRRIFLVTQDEKKNFITKRNDTALDRMKIKSTCVEIVFKVCFTRGFARENVEQAINHINIRAKY